MLAFIDWYITLFTCVKPYIGSASQSQCYTCTNQSQYPLKTSIAFCDHMEYNLMAFNSIYDHIVWPNNHNFICAHFFSLILCSHACFNVAQRFHFSLLVKFLLYVCLIAMYSKSLHGWHRFHVHGIAAITSWKPNCLPL